MANVKAITSDSMTKLIMANAKIMNGVPHVEIPCELLVLDAPYQRFKSERLEAKMANDFSNYKSGTVTVSLRNGLFYVLDGASRVRAAIMSGQETVNRIVHYGLTMENEAEMFAKQDKLSRPVTSQEKFWAMCIAGDENSNIVKEVCEAHGIKILRRAFSRTDVGGLNCPSVAVRIVELNGKEGFDWVAGAICDAGWIKQRKAFSDTVMRALGKFYDRHYSDPHDLEICKSFLATTTPKKLIGSAIEAYPVGYISTALLTYLDEKVKAWEK